MMIPYVMPELARAQSDALALNVKAPLVYVKVVVRNWRPWVKRGVHEISNPMGFYSRVKLDYPVSLGEYRCPRTPDEPMVLHLVNVPVAGDATMQRVRDGGIEAVRFGWAGATEQGRQHYYRVQGPLFLIEYDASQDGGNHIHTVWRDFNGDFGRDLLREHYQGTKGTAHRHSERSNPAS